MSSPTRPPRRPGFLSTLFDATFSKMLTVRLARTLYLLLLIAICTAAFVVLFDSLGRGPVAGVLALIVVPVLTLLAIAIVRAVVEALVVLFRMGEHVERMSETLYGLSTYLRSDERSDEDRAG
jgi:hypothetical protein